MFIYTVFLFFAFVVPLVAISLVSQKTRIIMYYCLPVNLSTPQTNFGFISAILPRV